MAAGPEPEELLESRHWQPTRRVWVGIAVAAAAAAGVGGVALAHGDDTDPQAARTSAAPTPSPTTVATASAVPRPVCLDVGDSALNCGVTTNLPHSVVAATQALLPTARAIDATTVTGRDGQVVSRRVLVQSDNGSTLQLQVSPNPGRPGRIDEPDDGRTVSYGQDVGRRHVQIVVRARTGTPVPTITALRKLAQDPRLLAVT